MKLKNKLALKYEPEMINEQIRFMVPMLDKQGDIIRYAKTQLVILDLALMQESERQRFMDFIFGAAYVLNLQILHIGAEIYIIAPEEIFVHDGAQETAPEKQMVNF